MPKIKQNLQKLYRTHGALTFLLAFYPMLPNVIESHTKGYLSLTKAITGSVCQIDDVIRIMFGQRGLQTYKEYQEKNPDQILPNEIYEALYEKNDIELVEKLMNKMFLDKAQRTLIHSDMMRASVILALPEMLRQFPGKENESFRAKLVDIVSDQAIIDQGLPSQLAFIEIALRLLTQVIRHKDHMEKEQLHMVFSGIEAKIKSELAGKSSAFTAPLRPFVDKQKNLIMLSGESASHIHEVLLLLAVSPAIEVREDAKTAILELDRIKKLLSTK